MYGPLGLLYVFGMQETLGGSGLSAWIIFTVSVFPPVNKVLRFNKRHRAAVQGVGLGHVPCATSG